MIRPITTVWTAVDLDAIRSRPLPERPVFGPGDCSAAFDGLWLWDFWPAERPDGQRAKMGGGELWFALSSPVLDDPDARHHIARIRMIHRVGDKWTDLGPAFPEDFTPGSREWSGSAVVEGSQLTLYFTAAGRRGEAAPSFEQRIFASSASVDLTTSQIGEWTIPYECFASDGEIYAHAREATGSIGSIKAFRDPAWFRDPADGAEYILFTGSVGGSASTHNGCIGVAHRDNGRWNLIEPLVTADGVNNELERPHLRFWNGRYNLFWSTQAHVFSDIVRSPQTGLYAMSAGAALGQYWPIEALGLIACNPRVAPMQAYSWWVGGDGEVSSFADRLGPDRAFAGALAPMFSLEPS